MAPILYALALLAQDPAPAVADGPVATQVPRKQDVAPLPIQGGPVTPPSDDYGYVAWCFGAVSGYVDLYDKAMPEVIRIERAWPTPGTEENISVVYPQQKKDALKSMELFKRAIVATEKASPTPISQQGAAAIKKGRAVWTGATSVPRAQLAQFWMSWAPPAKCDETAKALEARSILFGQALTYNAAPGAAPAPAAPTAAPEQTAAEAAPGETMDEGATTADGATGAPPVAPAPSEPAEAEAGDSPPVDSAIDSLLPDGAPAAETTPDPAAEALASPAEAEPTPKESEPESAEEPTPDEGITDIRGPL